MVEASQSRIRLVGLSATLPNYADVAVFLRVNPKTDLFPFDATYRPVPLTQQFVGVSDGNQMQCQLNMLLQAYVLRSHLIFPDRFHVLIIAFSGTRERLSESSSVTRS